MVQMGEGRGGGGGGEGRGRYSVPSHLMKTKSASKIMDHH